MDSFKDGESMTRRFELWVNLTIEAESEGEAFEYAFEAMCLAEGQGLMSHRPETVTSWSVEGPSDSESMWTTCGKCGKMTVEIIDESAPEFCQDCCICGNSTPDGFDHDGCLEGGSVEWVNIEA
jgi:hypothetical protein